MNDLKLKSRTLNEKFNKKKGACINPLSRSKPLKPKIINQLSSDLVLKGTNIGFNQEKSENAIKKSSAKKGTKKTFLYIKSTKFKNNNQNTTKVPEMTSIKQPQNQYFSFCKNGNNSKNWVKSDKPISLAIPNENKKKILWNTSLNPTSKKLNAFVKNPILNRLGSKNEGIY